MYSTYFFVGGWNKDLTMELFLVSSISLSAWQDEEEDVKNVSFKEQRFVSRFQGLMLTVWY